MTYRLGFLTTHPIQYQVPVFRELSRRSDVDVTVYFCQIPDSQNQGDGFGTTFQWDVPLLDGYHYEVLNNVSRNPSVTSFAGCDTPGIRERIQSNNFDAFVVNGWVVKSCLQALWACRKTNTPCIVRGEANDIRPRVWWKRAVQRQLVRQFSACAYIGQANARFYRSRGVTDSRLFPALYCVDNARFIASSSSIEQASARRTFNLKADSVVLLFSGKLIPKKHPLGLLKAVQLALADGANVECLVVGDGELREECVEYVRRSNLPVQFTGFLNQSQIAAAYVASDCLVLPSDHGETWGLVVNEAMASGRPAIVSNQVGCAEDLVIPGKTGRVFESGNWIQLSEIIKEISSKPGTLRDWGLHARQRVAEYSPEAAADGIMSAVKAICTQCVGMR